MKFYLALFCLGIFLSGCKSEMDDLIKKGSFEACPDHTVETLVTNYFDNPKWESFITPDDDKYHLNATGEIFYNDKPTKIELGLMSAENALTMFQEYKQDELINIINMQTNMQTYYDLAINGGIYDDVASLDGGSISDNKKGLRNNLAQQILHEQMVDMQYNK